MLVRGLAVGVSQVENTGVVLCLLVDLGCIPRGSLVGASLVRLAAGRIGECRGDNNVGDGARRNDVTRLVLSVVAGEGSGRGNRGSGEDGGEEELHLDWKRKRLTTKGLDGVGGGA